MRWIYLLFLLPLLICGSVSQRRASFMRTRAAAVVGGEGVTHPVWIGGGTNFSTSYSSAKVTNTVTSANDRIHLLFVSIYTEDGAPAITAQNNLSVSGTVLTNFQWYSANTIGKVFYWLNSDMTNATASFSAGNYEADLHLHLFTNVNQTTPFSGVKTNYSATGSAITNIVSSSTSSIVVSYDVVSGAGGSLVWTLQSGMVEISTAGNSSQHHGLVTTNTGAASVTESVAYSSGGGSHGLVSFSLSGP